MVDARRGRRMGSSGSSTEEDEEYPSEGAIELGDAAAGSSGMQCDVVFVRRSIFWGRNMMRFARVARRSMYCTSTAK